MSFLIHMILTIFYRDKKSREHSDGVHRRVNGVPAGAQPPNSESPLSQLVFKTEAMKKVQIDFNAGEPYGKVIRISLNGKYLASGGDDGHLRVFSFPDLDAYYNTNPYFRNSIEINRHLKSKKNYFGGLGTSRANLVKKFQIN